VPIRDLTRNERFKLSYNLEMEWFFGSVIFTAGMIVRILQVIAPQFPKRDLAMIGLSLILALLIVGVAALESEGGLGGFEWILLPISFAVIIAIAFKDKILPSVTEGLLFLYGLIGLHIFVKALYSKGMQMDSIDWTLASFFAVYMGAALFMIFFHKTAHKYWQTILMLLFILMNIYIGYIFIHEAIRGSSEGILTIFMFGYSSLLIISHVIYLLSFLPPPQRSKYEKNSGLENLKRQSAYLEQKFVATNAGKLQIFLILVAFGSLVVLDIYSPISDGLLLVLFIIVGTVLNRKPTFSSFTPKHILEKL
jgi:hypothetical protein